MARLPFTPALRRRAAWWGAFAAIVVVTLFARVVLDGRAELDAAAVENQRGRLPAEITHLGRAARWRAPVFQHDETARARLEAIGRTATVARDWPVALSAYRELRRSLWATRTWGRVADPAALQRADEAIATAMAVGGYDRDRARVELAVDPTPHARGLGIAALAFVAWIAAMVGFIRQGLDREGRVRPRPAVRWGFAVLLLLVLWMATMRHPQWLG